MTGHILRCNNSDIDEDEERSKVLLSEEHEEVDTLLVDSEQSSRHAESKLSLSRLLFFLSLRLVRREEG